MRSVVPELLRVPALGHLWIILEKIILRVAKIRWWTCDIFFAVTLGSNKISSKKLPSRRLSSNGGSQDGNQILDLTYKFFNCMPRGPGSEEAASAFWAEMRQVLPQFSSFLPPKILSLITFSSHRQDSGPRRESLSRARSRRNELHKFHPCTNVFRKLREFCSFRFLYHRQRLRVRFVSQHSSMGSRTQKMLHVR